MAKLIGDTFGDEVIAAGLGGLPFAWIIGGTDEQITGREQLNAAQNGALDGVIAVHNPDAHRKNIIATTDWVARFTNAEWLLLERQRADDIARDRVGYTKNLAIVMTEDNVDLNRQKVQRIKTDLVAAGVLTQARADEIFS